jgi:hypothetical protein
MTTKHGSCKARGLVRATKGRTSREARTGLGRLSKFATGAAEWPLPARCGRCTIRAGMAQSGGEATFAEMQSNGQDAPISAIDLEAMRDDRSEFDGLLTSFLLIAICSGNSLIPAREGSGNVGRIRKRPAARHRAVREERRRERTLWDGRNRRRPGSPISARKAIAAAPAFWTAQC